MTGALNMNVTGVTAKLICTFVFDFAYAKCWFSYDAAHFDVKCYADCIEKYANSDNSN